MLKKIGIVVLVMLVVLVAVVATRPDEFTVTRSRTIAAPPDAVFAQLSDFHRWQQWSPWERLDPAMKREFSGASAGKGAVYSWAGNDDVGEGRMTITEAQPAENVVIRLEFLEPMAMTSTTGFVLTPAKQGRTNVTWSMTGENNFISKGMSLFMNMDKMVGKDFEAGLARLDSVAAGGRTTAGEIPSGG
jgi:uncharacterized protein YndB with AHSA1/START domain